MNISVSYDDTDVAKALSKIIKDPNAEEFVKLLTPMLCNNSIGVDYFFKLMLGNKLPEPVAIGTLCKMPVESVGWGCNKDGIRRKYADAEDKIIVTVKEFRGYHEYSTYLVEFNDILPDDGSAKKESTYVRHVDLEVIEEF